jgi:hypothetical protein
MAVLRCLLINILETGLVFRKRHVCSTHIPPKAGFTVYELLVYHKRKNNTSFTDTEKIRQQQDRTPADLNLQLKSTLYVEKYQKKL